MYVFDKPDSELSETERRLKSAIIKRRQRQNRCYHRKKLRQKQEEEEATNAATGASSAAPKTETEEIPGPGQANTNVPALANLEWITPQEVENTNGVASSDAVVPRVNGGSENSLSNFLAVQTPTLLGAQGGPPTSPNVSGFTDLWNGVTSPGPVTQVQDFGQSQDDNEQQMLMLDQQINDFEQSLETATFGRIDEIKQLNRSAALKSLIFDSVRDRYARLPEVSRKTLRELSVFPGTFDLAGAGAIMGVEDAGINTKSVLDGLEALFKDNFLKFDGERVQLNDVAKLFIHEDAALSPDGTYTIEMDVAKDRLVDHFTSVLNNLNNCSIHKLGWAREQAMKVYDLDRHNMEFTYFLSSRLSKKRLRQFLAAGAAIMRFCVGAQTRITYFENALKEDETSNAYLALDSSVSTAQTGDSATSADDVHESKRREARLELALGEAFLDTLAPGDAEAPISRALALLSVTEKARSKETKATPAAFMDPSSSGAAIVDNVLVLLLLANLRMDSGNTDAAHVLLVKALKVLTTKGMGRTTFAVNALTNLVAIYLQKGETEKAKGVASELLDVLHMMKYQNMPIYADVLGVMATVSMAEGNGREAERQFAAALEIVTSWGTKQWSDIPVQHCLDLDLWLMQGLAKALKVQGRDSESSQMLALARQAWANRGLNQMPLVSDEDFRESTVARWLTYTRHIY